MDDNSYRRTYIYSSKLLACLRFGGAWRWVSVHPYRWLLLPIRLQEGCDVSAA